MNSVDSAAQLKKGCAVSKAGYSVSSGRVCITVDPRVGARITSLKLGAYEFITGPDVMEGNYGSTFWPSPQSDWSWPPPAVLDSEPYSTKTEGDTLQFVSSRDTRTGLQVVKKICPGKTGWLNLVYSMKNVTDSVRKVAPWEITRIRKGGLLFFPVGHNPLDRKSFDPAPVKIIDGVAWYRDAKKRPAENLLTTADGTDGWAAYAIDGRLFIKKFPNIDQHRLAPAEGEITVYVSKEADYVEFEIQGIYKALKPGENSDWQVEWTAVDIPELVIVKEGSGGLVEFARKLVK